MARLPHFTKPTIFLWVLAVVDGVGAGVYAAQGVEMDGGALLLSQLASVWGLGWWLEDDARRHGVEWRHDLGMFLVVLLPYHVIKTRGVRALITVFWFVAMRVTAYVVSLLLFLLLRRN